MFARRALRSRRTRAQTVCARGAAGAWRVSLRSSRQMTARGEAGRAMSGPRRCAGGRAAQRGRLWRSLRWIVSIPAFHFFSAAARSGHGTHRRPRRTTRQTPRPRPALRHAPCRMPARAHAAAPGASAAPPSLQRRRRGDAVCALGGGGGGPNGRRWRGERVGRARGRRGGALAGWRLLRGLREWRRGWRLWLLAGGEDSAFDVREARAPIFVWRKVR